MHVECGTQALGGAVHNARERPRAGADLGRCVAGTQDGELRGSRNEFIQWIQDVPDQRGIVRGYVKYENEIRTAHNTSRSSTARMQFAPAIRRGRSI